MIRTSLMGGITRWLTMLLVNSTVSGAGSGVSNTVGGIGDGASSMVGGAGKNVGGESQCRSHPRSMDTKD